ncbi:MAG: L-serine ammonia-lyase, iron-sulfur-dependent, subunit alpha [Erysipelotrichaceae bacterium]|nr:L-serine ammonia-lyase, iron-sulfur-dependent, subunit alpha [Erysipelotrichaceae bacterium]
MQSIRQLYKIGFGPSSSHTIAPYRIAKFYKQQFCDCNRYEVLLGGSLALTAKGHGTIDIIKTALECEDVDFIIETDIKQNLMQITGFSGDKQYETWHGESLGGGDIRIDEFDTGDSKEVYSENTFDEIKEYLKKNDKDLVQYVYDAEPELKAYLKECLKVMFDTVETGLSREGLINEELKYYRVAKGLYEKAADDKGLLVAYSYATCEQNASGGMMCTAPTLGACGILTSFLYHLYHDKKESIDRLCDLMAVAGIFANCIKRNASIAGSTGGCQAEVGTACSMTAAAIAYYNGAELDTIEYAAEMGIEHFLGLTCDPVLGYVIIPCIERNAVSIMKAYECAFLAMQLKGLKSNLISFDSVVHAMNYTGHKLAIELKETSLGGLSLEYRHE